MRRRLLAALAITALVAAAIAPSAAAAGTITRFQRINVSHIDPQLLPLLADKNRQWAFYLFSPLLGANYGANLALFPAATKDYFGLKNFGVNYGWVFTAWGVGGFVFPYISGKVFDRTGSFTIAYFIAGGCLIAAALVALFLKAPAPAAVDAPAAAPPTAAKPAPGLARA